MNSIIFAGASATEKRTPMELPSAACLNVLLPSSANSSATALAILPFSAILENKKFSSLKLIVSPLFEPTWRVIVCDFPLSCLLAGGAIELSWPPFNTVLPYRLLWLAFIVNALYWLKCLIFGQNVRYYEFLPSFSALKGSLAPNQAIMLRIVTKGLFVR